MEELREKK